MPKKLADKKLECLELLSQLETAEPGMQRVILRERLGLAMVELESLSPIPELQESLYRLRAVRIVREKGNYSIDELVEVYQGIAESEKLLAKARNLWWTGNADT